MPIETQFDDRDRRIELELSNFGIHMTDNLAWYFDVTWWRQTCLASSRKIEMSSIDRTAMKIIPLHFLTLKTPKLTLILLFYNTHSQRKNTVMTWSMTSSRDAKMSSVESTVLKVIPLNFSTSKTLKTIPIKLMYDFYNPRYNTWHFDVMYDVITWRQSVKRWSYSLGNDSIEFFELKNLEKNTNKVALRLLQPEIQYMTLWSHVWRHHVTSKC